MLIDLGAPSRSRGLGSHRFATAPRGCETRDARRGPSGFDPWRHAESRYLTGRGWSQLARRRREQWLLTGIAV